MDHIKAFLIHQQSMDYHGSLAPDNGPDCDWRILWHRILDLSMSIFVIRVKVQYQPQQKPYHFTYYISKCHYLSPQKISFLNLNSDIKESENLSFANDSLLSSSGPGPRSISNL